jgi:uncharacterized repeat protein (TIGR03803 family)
MKMCVKNFVLPALVVVFGLLVPWQATAQTFTILYSFPPTVLDPTIGSFVNTNGFGPVQLLLSSNTFYGSAGGGSSGNGTVFRVNTDWTAFTNLYSFSSTPPSCAICINSDGAGGVASFLSGNTLYGTAGTGGSGGSGTLFALKTDGTGFTILYSFTETSGGINSDGSGPVGPLVLSGNTLYGTTPGGGSSGNGTVFALNTDGTGFTTLHSFTATSALTNSDGAVPEAELVLSGSTLYGTASTGGSYGSGTVFSISLPPQLTITPAAANVILTWPTNFTGFTLQSTTNLASPAWTANLPAVVVVNGLNTVTNPISGIQQFFRLSQ